MSVRDSGCSRLILPTVGGLGTEIHSIYLYSCLSCVFGTRILTPADCFSCVERERERKRERERERERERGGGGGREGEGGRERGGEGGREREGGRRESFIQHTEVFPMSHRLQVKVCPLQTSLVHTWKCVRPPGQFMGQNMVTLKNKKLYE